MTVVLAIFATWRVAHLFAEETGPGGVAIRFRNLYTAQDWIGEGMRCVLCLSFWLALPACVVVLVLDPSIPIWAWPFYWLGIAGGAAAFEEATHAR